MALLACLTLQPVFATDVSTGFDLYTNAPGSFFDATAFGLGIIPMVGYPFGPYTTNIIYERDNGFTCATPPCLGNTVNIHMFAFALESASPVNIGGSFFDVFETINDTAGVIPLSSLPQPDVLNPSTGTYTVDEQTGSGGAFDMSMTIWADVIIADVGQGINEAAALSNSNCATPPCHFSAPAISISETGGTWDTTAAINDLHSGTYPAGSFYVSGTGNVTGPIQYTESLSPEPSSALLLAGALLGLYAGRRSIRGVRG